MVRCPKGKLSKLTGSDQEKWVVSVGQGHPHPTGFPTSPLQIGVCNKYSHIKASGQPVNHSSYDKETSDIHTLGASYNGHSSMYIIIIWNLL